MADMIRKNGDTSVREHIKLVDPASGSNAGLPGLTFSTTGLIISTLADGENTATVYTAAGSTIETVAAIGTYVAPTATKCRFKEVDATNHPGLYELQLADARYGYNGARYLDITITAPNIAQCDYRVRLVAVNMDDSVRMGMGALPNVATGLAGAIPTVGTGTAQINVSGGNVPVDFTQVLPTLPTANTLGEALFLLDNIAGRINTAQAGGNNTITLDASASSTAGSYVGYDIFLYSGTGGGIRGVGQRRTIIAYNTTTKVATVDRAWATNPDSTTKFILFYEPKAELSSYERQRFLRATYQCSGTVYCVSTGGSSGNDGLTWDTAFALPSQAAAVAVAGDKILLGLGTFAQASTQVALPAGVDLIGNGDGSIITGSMDLTTTGPIVKIGGSNTTVRDMSIVSTASSGFDACVGNYASTTCVNVRLQNLRLVGRTDCIYFTPLAGSDYSIQNIRFTTAWDAIYFGTDISNPACTILIENFSLLSTGSAATASNTGLGITLTGGNHTVLLKNGDIRSTTSVTNANARAVYTNSVTDIVNVSFRTAATGGGTAKDIYNASGTAIRVYDCDYDFSKTNGTITVVSTHGTDVQQWLGSAPNALQSGRVDAYAGATAAALTFNLTGNITGSLSGSVGSVTGNVGGNVAGSVASVTGNVGGNVTGSIGSLATGAIVAASFATDALSAAAVSTAAVSKIQSGLSTYAGGDTSGTTTLLGRLSAARAAYLDNLSGGAVALAAGVIVTTNNDKTGYGLSATQTFSNTGTWTGNLSGSVGSVAGNVGGNVVGSVASVTGNVGGNVAGSVASVTGNVGGSVASVTGNVGGNVTGSVGSLGTGAIIAASFATDAISGGAVSAAAVTKIQTGLATSTALGSVASDASTAAAASASAASSAASAASSSASAASNSSTAATNTTTILARLGAWTGSGLNTVLGAFRALLNKTAALTPSDLTAGGLGFDNTTDSTEALRDHGDAAWITATGFASAADYTAGRAAKLDHLDVDVSSVGSTAPTVNVTVLPLSATVSAGQVQDLDLVAYQHAAQGYSIVIVDDLGEAVDLSSSTVTFVAYSVTDPLTELFRVDCTVTGTDGNVAHIQLTSTETDTALTCNWSLHDVDNDMILTRGSLEIVPTPQVGLT